MKSVAPANVLYISHEVSTERARAVKKLEIRGAAASKIEPGSVRASPNRARATLLERKSALEVASENLLEDAIELLPARKGRTGAAKSARGPEAPETQFRNLGMGSVEGEGITASEGYSVCCSGPGSQVPLLTFLILLLFELTFD